jgi:hypothetical protein
MRLMRNQPWSQGFCTNRGPTAMERYRIRRMAERLAVKITRNVPQDRFKKELWDLAAIIEEHLLSEMVQLEGHPKKSHYASSPRNSVLSVHFLQTVRLPSSSRPAELESGPVTDCRSNQSSQWFWMRWINWICAQRSWMSQLWP